MALYEGEGVNPSTRKPLSLSPTPEPSKAGAGGR